MVCSLGSGRMAVMARVLEAGSLSQPMAEDIYHQKLASQLIHRYFREADEANLLDEEDMHVYGLKPMAEPLHLVCCDACKKPIKASQYAAHAELCRLLNSTGETILEYDGGRGHKKPPRKERKKLSSSYANQTTSALEQERFESISADDTAASKPRFDGQKGRRSSFSLLAKRKSASVDAVASMKDGSGLNPENTDQSTCVMLPPTKWSKLKAGKRPVVADDLETTLGRNSPKGTASGSEMPCDSVGGYKKPGQEHGHSLLTGGSPVPLATKIYYSQKNNRLRSALSYIYWEAAAPNKELCGDGLNQQVAKESVLPLQASSQGDSSLEQIKDLLNNKTDAVLSAQNSDQILPQKSELFLDNSGGCLPGDNFQTQFTEDNVPRPQVAAVALGRNKYLSKSFSFAGNSEKPLSTMQQPNGSVHVV